jgi:hypothetical protein
MTHYENNYHLGIIGNASLGRQWNCICILMTLYLTIKNNVAGVRFIKVLIKGIWVACDLIKIKTNLTFIHVQCSSKTKKNK